MSTPLPPRRLSPSSRLATPGRPCGPPPSRRRGWQQRTQPASALRQSRSAIMARGPCFRAGVRVTDTPPAAFVDPLTIAGHRRTYKLTRDEIHRARTIASGIVGSDEPMHAATSFLHDRLRPAYGFSGYRRQPLEVLEQGRGDCFETSAVAAMLLRSLGVPCRFVTEICAARFEPGAALAVLIPTAAAGPCTNSHVWLEASVHGRWEPVDVQFGVWEQRQWESTRLQPRGGRFGFRFPVQLRSLDTQGAPEHDLAGPYLLQPFDAQRDSDAFKSWADDLDHFRQLRRGSTFLGARLTLMLPRLRRMARNLETLLARR